MAEERQQSWLERFFWPVLAVGLVAVVAVVVIVINALQSSNDNLKSELNNRYVEKIDIEYDNGGDGSKKVILINGERRYDCKEADARLTCTDDPQPTVERSTR